MTKTQTNKLAMQDAISDFNADDWLMSLPLPHYSFKKSTEIFRTKHRNRNFGTEIRNVVR